MALPNGVLVHGPTSWACAVRLPDGRLKIVAEPKTLRGADVKNPLLRGPARMLDALLLLPRIGRRVPEAKLPFQRPGILAAMLGTAVAVKGIRNSNLPAFARELAGGLLSLTPALMALRGGELAAYHGAEHITIGSYEHDEPRPREHERCGTHLVGPLIATSAFGNVLASRAPASLRGPARAVAGVAAVAASTELFSWMVRNPEHPVAAALARPGHELQHHLATAEPSTEQLEVARAALDACLELEHGHQPQA
jgi:uncharacterized protein YqhQ